MKLNRQELCDVLNSLKPGLAASEIVEQSTHFIFDTNRIYTFNDQIMVTQHYTTKIKGSIEGQTLLKVLNKMPDEEINLSSKAEDEDELRITGKKREVGLKMITDVAITIPFDMKQCEWFKLPKDFTAGLKFCIFSASEDATKGPLVCVQSKGDTLTSCDNYRLTMYQMDKEFKFSFLLPRSAAKHLITYEPTLFTSTDAWLHFQNEGKVTFSCRTMGDEYPNMKHLFKFEGEPVKLPENFKSSVERAGLLSTSDFDHDRKVTLTLSDDKIVCKGEGKQGWIKEEEDLKYSGKEVEFTVHPTFLGEILTHSTKVKIGENKLLFRSSKFQHIVILAG